MRGSASTTPKRPWDSATGSWTPRAIQSVSASRSKVKAQAARASAGQWGGREEVTESVIGDIILAQGETPPPDGRGAWTAEGCRSWGEPRQAQCSIDVVMVKCVDLIQRLEENVSRALVGKTGPVRLAVVGLLARGHLLIEDVPGVGKTTLAAALARSIGAGFQRIQFTSDMLPSDVIGVSIWEPTKSEFVFKPGPLFTNIVLADEINRATPKTQSSLLEAMNEAQVSLDHSTYPLPRPFMVLATQNPREHEGTYPLPESQLDRFLLRIRIGYPGAL